ncbi:hypothetical protein [uncultured Shewanella sp.]|uniref:hypothetical protein n=1 Tax=uncultured Shewanella sp. TaxID=173975 RepID=UPI002611AF83|nr:hypothetical protein [uncultured Shewanella sp.]
MIEIESLNEKLIVYNCVYSIHLDVDVDTLQYNLLLTLTESEDFYTPKFQLHFLDISDLKVADVGGGLTQFMHLQINSVNDGLERNSYRLIDCEENKVSFNFYDVKELLEN